MGFVFGESELTLDLLDAIAFRRTPVALSVNSEVVDAIQRSADHVSGLLEREGRIYGVTTGYGDSVVTEIPPDLVAELPLHLTRFHGCGTGRFLTDEETRAVLAVRLTLVASMSMS